MAFKMKGPSIHKGTARHRSQVKAHQKQLRLNRSMDSTNLPDGRSKSSMFQMKSSAFPYVKRSTFRQDEGATRTKTLPDGSVITEQWNPTTRSYEEILGDKGEVLGQKTIFTTTGVKTTTKESQSVIDFKEACYDAAGNFLEGQTRNGILCEKAGPGYVKPEDEIIKEDLLKKSEEIQMNVPDQCECEAYKNGEPTGIMIKHPCGKPNVNCQEFGQDIPCRCTNAETGETVEYPKNQSGGCDPKPPECTPKPPEKGACELTKAELKAKQDECSAKSTANRKWRFSLRTCACKSEGGQIWKGIKETVGDCFEWKNPKTGKAENICTGKTKKLKGGGFSF